MNHFYFRQKKAIFSIILGLFGIGMAILPVSQANAAGGNLIKNPSFEQGNVDTYWLTWNNQPQTRTYTMFRSYDAPFGNGSYSAGIDTTGTPGGLYDGGIVTNPTSNPFTVTAGKTYYFSLYTKASTPTTISIYLQKANNLQFLAPAQQVAVSTQWEKKQIAFQVTDSADAVLGMAFGNMPDNATLYLDGLDLSENNLTVATSTVTGFIDEQKTLAIANGSRLTVDDVRIELPYFNPNTNTIETKRFVPMSINGGTARFTLAPQTFSGVGKVYVFDTLIGSFNYNVYTKVTDFSPDPFRPDEDLVVYGSGFHPDATKDSVLITSIAVNGSTSTTWLRPHTVDSSLTQLVVKLPVGLAHDKLQVRTYFTNSAGAIIENRSNMFAYTVQPVIYTVSWTDRGHENVGDKISIQGKGIVYRSTVNFYNEQGQLITRKNATVKKIITGSENYEVIEVATPTTLNKVKVTVTSGPNESEKADALQYIAKPNIASIKTTHRRTLPNSNIVMPAAKVGEVIRLQGNGFKTATSASVEFWSIHNRVTTVTVDTSHIDPNGTWVDVTVPAGTQSGLINVQVNGQKSNNTSLEVIPVILSRQPAEPVPGQELTLTVQGSMVEASQITVYFKMPNNQEITVDPLRVEKIGDNVLVTILAPRAIPNQGSTLRIQSGYWLDDNTYRLTVTPTIQQATITSDTKILSIKGYGFATNIRDNKINFKYADGTVVTPRIQMIDVYTTSEGQEIRLKILDSYYYGYVSVTVGTSRSNEVNIGPAVITRLERRVQYVQSEKRVMGVLYISGRNFGTNGDVRVGRVWAQTHYRSNTFIIAVVEQSELYGNPVIVTKR